MSGAKDGIEGNRTLISGGTVLCCDDNHRILEAGVVGVDGDRIVYLGECEPVDPQWAKARRIDASTCLVIPGLINAHTHVGMTVMRGLADDLPLFEWLRDKVWPMEAAMSAEDRSWSAQLAMAEMLRAGVTCFLDMSLDAGGIAEACLMTGIRAQLSEVLLETQDPQWKTLDAAAELAAEWNRREDPLVHFDLGPHALYTCSKAYLERILAFAGELDARLQIHISETRREVEDCLRDHGMSPVKLLEQWGLFKRPTTAAHCIHLDETDREILARRRVVVAHNPSSNMKLGAGIMGAEALMRAGVTLALGTDSAASNNNLSVMGEMRRASLLQKAGDGDPTSLPAKSVLRMATRGGALSAGRQSELGQIREGWLADIVIIRRDGLHAWPPHDPASQLCYSLRESDVDTVMVGGEILLEDGRFTRLDLDELRVRTAAIADRITLGLS